MNGTDREQLTFAIANGVCVPLKIDDYKDNRCFQPTPVDTVRFSSTAAPTGGECLNVCVFVCLCVLCVCYIYIYMVILCVCFENDWHSFVLFRNVC